MTIHTRARARRSLLDLVGAAVVSGGVLLAGGVGAIGCGTDPGDASVDASDAAPDDDGVDFHDEDHGLPDPEPLPALPEIDEHELAFVPTDLDDAPLQAFAAPSNCEKVRVVNTGGATLRVRPDPSTHHTPLGSLDAGQVVTVNNAVTGESINGTTRWYEITTSALTGFVSGAFTQCIDVDAPVHPTFKLPLRCHRTARVTQGNNTSFSHSGRSRYAFDFGLARGTPLVATADGRVVAVRGSTRPGDACWSGGGPECASQANYVILQHSDGTQTVYAHLDSPSVALGARVHRGDVVGLSGGTGYSTGPHAHVARQDRCGSTFCQTIEMRFADVTVHSGIPRSGESVTSGNCP